MKPITRVLALVFLIALVACGQVPPPELAPASIKGTAISLDEFYVPQGAALLMVDSDTLDMTSAAAPVELAPGIYSTALAPIDADGKFEIFLPEGDEIPAGVTVQAAEFLELSGAETCALSATVADAQVSRMVTGFGPSAFPNVFFLSVFGSSPSFTTATPVDFDDPGFDESELQLVSWLYASTDVEITTPAGGCDMAGETLTVNLALTAGWNQVEMTFEADPDTSARLGTTISNSTAEELYFYAIGGSV